MLFSSTTSSAAGTITVRMTRSWGDRRLQRTTGASTPGNPRLSSLLEAALAAASDDLQWPIFLDALSSELRASTMSLFLSDPVGQQSTIQFAVGKDPSYVKAYNEHFATVSPFFGDWSHERWREGVIERSAEVCPDRLLLRTEYYNDWLRPQRIHHLARGVVAREGQASWVLSFGRPKGSGSFTAQEMALFGAILPGLRGALQLRHHLLVARSERDAASAAFDALRIGVIFLDACDSPIRINSRAQAILDAADGLKVERGMLSASCSTDTARLRRLIGQARDTTRQAIHSGGGTIALNRPSGREPLHAVVTPLPRDHFSSGSGVAVSVVFVMERERESPVDHEVVRSLYGLTDAEAAVVEGLVRGLTLRQISAERRASIHTVRTQMKSVLSKTGAGRQAELVRQILHGPAVLVPARPPVREGIGHVIDLPSRRRQAIR
jgi:DNA-binding CsgD family transcriptional regulator